MLTKGETKQLGAIRKRWAPPAVGESTRPINDATWAQEDIDALIALVEKLQADALAYEKAISATIDWDDYDY